VRTIVIVNQKGGCGKTTTAINLASIYARRGLRTLLVDMDPQSHCAAGLGVPEEAIDVGIADALVADLEREFDPEDLTWEVTRNLDLVPSTMRLAALEAPGGGLHELPDKDRRLERLLSRMSARYDRCLIDSPPTIGLLTFNALRAAREALVPVETGFFALKGARKQWITIHRLIERIDRPIACHLLATLHKPDSDLACRILNTLRRDFAGQILPIVIREHEALREATSFGQPIIEYDPQSAAMQDFEALADWLEEHAARPTVQIEVMRNSSAPPAPAHEARGADAQPDAPDDVESASSRDRAGELVRRVHDLARRSAELRDATTVEDGAVALAPDQAPVPGVATAPKTTESEGDQPPLGFGVHEVGRMVVFVQPGGPEQSICIAGDFNQWSPSALPMRYNPNRVLFEAAVRIPPGRYQYRLVVDGQWQSDGYNAQYEVNAYGERNSVVNVGQEQVTP
jgi:chromosome partitioning protein